MYRKIVAFICIICFMDFVASAQTLATADSLFGVKQYRAAKKIYEKLLADTSAKSVEWNRLGFCNQSLGSYDEALKDYKKSESNNPPAALQPILYSRMAMAYGFKGDKQNAVGYMDKAIAAGYANFTDMDTAKAFAGIRNDEKFKALRGKAYVAAFPCSADTLRRQFDFWIGEWDAYVTGTTLLAGHSIIQSASGGCMILENWTSANTPYSGKSMNFIDAATGKWQQVWVGAEGGPQHVFVNGEYRDGAMRFEFEQAGPDGKKQKGRFIFYNQGANQVRQFNETSNDGGVTWNTAYDLTYVRKSKG